MLDVSYGLAEQVEEVLQRCFVESSMVEWCQRGSSSHSADFCTPSDAPHSNWRTWKYKVGALLCGVSGCLDILEGTLQEPEALKIEATLAEVTLYNSNVERFVNAESNALLILTTNMTEDMLEKIMRFSTAREMWIELHRLFDRGKNLTNELCAFANALKSRTADLGQEVLTTTSRKVLDKSIGKETKHVSAEESVGAVKGLMAVTASLASYDDDHGWYVDNGATNHDDFSRFRSVYYMREKSEVPEKLRSFLKETQVIGHVIKEFLSTNGGAFDTEKME
ncbi:hypothetical protein PR048_027428 [Dryococelus australis]|uniref:Uncharacterized protein n=1 Tax=Dryococelus australis TaxID=614101 RepID=A0ABQ9GGM8_9NEOP|nr:hypothetical protein PR048_027428 [Dryococelus australis]